MISLSLLPQPMAMVLDDIPSYSEVCTSEDGLWARGLVVNAAMMVLPRVVSFGGGHRAV
jgi:hypothetical protein